MSEEDNIWVALINGIEPVIGVLLDVLPFPLNAVVGFIWGGIRELVLEVLFG